MLDHVAGLRERAESGDILFGTMDSFILWHLTGGVSGGVHVTDVTNASRTLLDGPRRRSTGTTSCWRPSGSRGQVLPEIRSSSEVYGTAVGPAAGVPIAGILGDQQAALFGQACYDVGEAKNTYGTGCFMLLNTGEQLVPSASGLLTTVGYQLGDAPAVYALEGSIAIAGARSSSGCGTTSVSSNPRPRSRPWPPPSTTTAGCTSFPPFRAVRSLLAQRCPRRHRRAHPLRQQGPHRPGRPRSDGLANP